MLLSTLDRIVIALCTALILVVAFRQTRKSSKDTESYFLGSRKLPWWLAGTSMVATTFAADTPLLITELVASNGISGNWLWWNGMLGGMVAAFFFAAFWRKSGLLTDVEFVELRYGGKAGRFLRMFKAVYLGVFMNAVIIAWVNVAFGSVLRVFFDLEESEVIFYIAAAMAVVVVYVAVSGFLGVVMADFVQFIMAMGGCIALAWLVLDSDKTGGISGLKEKLPESTFQFLPDIGNSAESTEVFAISIATFFAYLGVQWWASWYPGAEPGGGGYIAQRMMSTKDEKSAVKATLFFQIAHYALRPWPWIIVALAALVLYPELPEADKKLGYVLAMRDFLPDGLKGFLLTAFMAAYMSTISTQLNWGAGYLTNDLIKPLSKEKKKNEKTLVAYSRWITVLLSLIALGVTTQITTLEGAFQFMIQCGAGLGGVLIMRWYWWRISAYSEIIASVTPFLFYSLAVYVLELKFPHSLFFTAGLTTLSWLIFTLLSPQPINKNLQDFYEKTEPKGFWKPFQNGKKFSGLSGFVLQRLGMTIAGVILGYSLLFGIGYLLFGFWVKAAVTALIVVLSALLLSRLMKQSGYF